MHGRDRFIKQAQMFKLVTIWERHWLKHILEKGTKEIITQAAWLLDFILRIKAWLALVLVNQREIFIWSMEKFNS